MIKAFAPAVSRGGSWVWLSIVLAVVLSAPAGAQTGTKSRGTKAAAKEDASKGEDAPAAKAKPDAKDAAKDDKGEAPAEEQPEQEKKAGGVEFFKDARAEAILAKKFRTLGRMLPDREASAAVAAVKRMAAAQEPVDRAVIQRAVDAMIFNLTNATNIAALAQGNEGKDGAATKRALKIQEAVDNLVVPLETARKGKNAAFLKDYNQILLTSLPPLLENNLYARIEVMIVLAQTGDPAAVRILTKQLAEPEQTVWVKLWAAKGLANVAGEGTVQLPTATAVEAARAVAGWLEKEKDLPWPAQLRGLEALGALRQAAAPTSPNKPEFATVAMRFLSDPKARPEVRAYAAWALGLMRVTSAINKFNFSLVAHNVGELAAAFGEKAHDAFDENPGLSEHWTGLLLYQLLPALEGTDGARESGLLHAASHPNYGPSQNLIKQLHELMKPVAKASVDLLRSSKGQVKNKKKELSERVASLRLFLEKNAPAENRLVPGGPQFPIDNQQVAEAPAGK
jgi:hypothetical protein